ncbi:MAG: hypothetical protein ACYCYK_04480 [Candidatus Dormibacteria bacterium]
MAEPYTYGGDLAQGVVLAMERPEALNQDFNLFTSQSTTVLELAQLLWANSRGPEAPFRYVTGVGEQRNGKSR